MDFSAMCPKYEIAAEILSHRWTCLILRSLVEAPRRSSEITAYVPGLSDRLLSERLQDLETVEIVQRRVLAQRPVLITYSLTDKGMDLRRVMEALQEWADRWVRSDQEKRSPDKGVRRPTIGADAAPALPKP